MSRSIVLSNGELAVALDEHAAVRDLYFPHVGQEDHVRGHYIHRVGVWADGRLSWLSSGEWQIAISCEEEFLASSVIARHEGLGIELQSSDIVHSERPIFMRRVVVRNLFDRAREIKLYFNQQFEIHKMHGSDTAYFDPSSHSIIHYKGKRVFLIGGTLDDEPFTDYATGRANFQGKEGTHRDAEDGNLSKNAIEHGPADSVIGFYASYAPDQSRTCEYYLAAAFSIRDARREHEHIQKKTPARLRKETAAFWRTWVRAREPSFKGLDAEEVALFRRSLMYIRAHADNHGGIIASLDSDMLQYGLDTYSYVWPRDAAYSALVLDRAGDTAIAGRFFEFCRQTITDEGYFMHKYWPDTALGSSWHPWIMNGQSQLPIQEDETAIVLYALHEHILRSGDMKFSDELYEPLVKRVADFLISYRDQATKLPLPSYDLWERKRGTSTYTSASVYGALIAAAGLAHMRGGGKEEKRYLKAAEEIREGILTYLWREEAMLFYNMINVETGSPVYDATIDISSVYGVFLFGVLAPDDPKLHRAFEQTVLTLSEGVSIGGIARFENDDYYRVPGPSEGNPWFLTTLWYAEFLVARASTARDLERVRDIFKWTKRYALSSGVMSEQLDPHTGSQICAGPLTWAHAAYVNVVLKYLERLKALT